jgi:hypothetical protein
LDGLQGSEFFARVVTGTSGPAKSGNEYPVTGFCMIDL